MLSQLLLTTAILATTAGSPQDLPIGRFSSSDLSGWTDQAHKGTVSYTLEDGALKAKAYVLTQDDLEGKLESLGLEPFNLYQVNIRELATLTGLDYGPLAGADTMAPSTPDAQVVSARPIGARSEIVR